ncbi:MAG: thiol-disulfide oxidoreductase DCC family protein [Sphingobacteriales bacterium]
MDTTKKIILFDGVCNLCSSSVQFVLKRDKKNQFLFGSLQGNYGQQILKENNLSSDIFNSFILLEEGKIYTRSTGALRMLKHLGGGWSLLYSFIIVPKFIRDAVYNFISRKRYKWFGKKEECWLPKPEWKKKFLD